MAPGTNGKAMAGVIRLIRDPGYRATSLLVGFTTIGYGLLGADKTLGAALAVAGLLPVALDLSGRRLLRLSAAPAQLRHWKETVRTAAA